MTVRDSTGDVSESWEGPFQTGGFQLIAVRTRMVAVAIIDGSWRPAPQGPGPAPSGRLARRPVAHEEQTSADAVSFTLWSKAVGPSSSFDGSRRRLAKGPGFSRPRAAVENGTEFALERKSWDASSGRLRSIGESGSSWPCEGGPSRPVPGRFIAQMVVMRTVSRSAVLRYGRAIVAMVVSNIARLALDTFLGNANRGSRIPNQEIGPNLILRSAILDPILTTQTPGSTVEELG
jgi:hypothetical protein